jgi:8-oxoguanine deaminase
LKYGSANVSHKDALHLGTTGGAALFHRQDIGEIAVGKQADVALFNLEELRFSGAGDPIAALVLCGAHRAEAVMVAGKWRVREHQLVDIDLAQVMNDQKKAALKLTG